MTVDQVGAERVAIVTGATQAMGETIARHLGMAGWAIAGLGRSHDRGEAVAQRLRDDGIDAAFFAVDLSEEARTTAVVAEVVGHFGRVDAVVNNAAALDADNGEGAIHDMSSEAFDEIMKVGVYGPFWLARAVVPHMIRAGAGGSLVNISSYASAVGISGLPAYSASKGAIESLTRQMAAEYGPDGIRSNALVLGSIHVPRTEPMHGDAARAEASRRGRMIARAGTPDDVGALVAFLCSDQAGFITGTCIPVDGGLLAKAPAVQPVHGKGSPST